MAWTRNIEYESRLGKIQVNMLSNQHLHMLLYLLMMIHKFIRGIRVWSLTPLFYHSALNFSISSTNQRFLCCLTRSFLIRNSLAVNIKGFLIVFSLRWNQMTFTTYGFHFQHNVFVNKIKTIRNRGNARS